MPIEYSKPWEKPVQTEQAKLDRETEQTAQLLEDFEFDREAIMRCYNDLVNGRQELLKPKPPNRFILPPHTFYERVGQHEILLTFASNEELQEYIQALNESRSA